MIPIVFALGVLCGSLATYFIQRPAGEPTPVAMAAAPERTSASRSGPAPRPAPEAPVRTSLAPGTVPTDPGAVAAEPVEEPTYEELSAEVARLRAEGEHGGRPWENVLRGLVGLGTPEGVGLALEVMGQQSVDTSADSYADLFRGVDDPRIFPAARACLEANQEVGLTSWYETKGFVEIIAEHGGAEGGRMILDAIRGDGTLQYHATGAVGLVDAPELTEEFLDILRAGGTGRHMQDIAGGMLSWQEPVSRGELLNVLLDPELQMEPRIGIRKALATHQDPQALSDYVETYWTLDLAEDRVAFVSSLGYLGSAGRATREERAAAAMPALVSALRDPDPDVFSAALSRVGDGREFGSPEVIGALEALLAAAESSGERKRVLATLTKIRRRQD